MKKLVSAITILFTTFAFVTFCFAGDDPPAPQDPKAGVSIVEILE